LLLKTVTLGELGPAEPQAQAEKDPASAVLSGWGRVLTTNKTTKGENVSQATERPKTKRSLGEQSLSAEVATVEQECLDSPFFSSSSSYSYPTAGSDSIHQGLSEAKLLPGEAAVATAAAAPDHYQVLYSAAQLADCWKKVLLATSERYHRPELALKLSSTTLKLDYAKKEVLISAVACPWLVSSVLFSDLALLQLAFSQEVVPGYKLRMGFEE